MYFGGMQQQRQRRNRWDMMPGGEADFAMQAAGMAQYAVNASLTAQRVADRLYQQQQQQADYLAALEQFSGREQQVFGPMPPLGNTVGSNLNRLAPYANAHTMLPDRLVCLQVP